MSTVAGVTRVFAGAALMVACVLVTSPRVPYAWDAVATWNARAELERDAPGTLLRQMRTPADWPLLMPVTDLHVYPVAQPMITGALARALPPELSAKRAADLWLTALVGLLFASLRATLAPHARASEVAAVLLMLVSPFALVHLRSGYVDLTVGVLAALASTCAIRVLHTPSTSRWLAWAVVASVLCQTKPEGVLLLVAGSITAVAMAGRTTAGGRPLLWLAAVPVANVAGWWLLTRVLFGAGMPPVARAVGEVVWSRLPVFGYEVARHLLDVDTWGVTWGLLLGMALGGWRGWWVLHAGLVLAALAAAHVTGPPQMMDYLTQGAVMNRLLLQVLVGSLPFLLPLARPASR